jgi:hypothetical protein
MTNIRAWQASSRSYLEKILHHRLERLIDDIVRVTGDKNKKEMLGLVKDFKKELVKDLDLFKIQRILYRHELIFRGNKKIDIQDMNT